MVLKACSHRLIETLHLDMKPCIHIWKKKTCLHGYVDWISYLCPTLQVQNCYRIKKEVPSGAKSPPVKPKDVWPQQPPASAVVPSYDSVKDAADTAAYRLAEAENKSFLAAEAVKEAERLSKLAEDADSILQLVKEIYEQCTLNKQLYLFV